VSTSLLNDYIKWFTHKLYISC